MEKDIVPSLLELIEKEFDEKTYNSEVLKKSIQALKDNKATYKDANEFAIEVGEILSEVLNKNITAEILPDGRMYFNIANRILNPTMAKNHELISSYAADVQTTLNRNAGLRIKGQKSELNQSRIDGIIERLSNEEDFEKIKWVLDEPIINFSQAIVDDTAKVNMDFQARAGLEPKIRRVVVGDCCDWCRRLAGTYEYGKEPEDIYRRHRYCRCRVEYYPGDGRKQNAHTKEWTDPEREAKIEERKKIGNKSTKPTKTLSEQFADTPAMNEYDYFSPEQEQFRLKSIQELSGASEAESKEILEALCGTIDEYKGVGNNVPKGWFSGSDTNIRTAKSGEYFEKAKTIDSYIDKSPKYRGDIYRGLSLDDATIKQFQQGGTFVENGNLSSWTSDKSIAQMFADGRSEELGTKRVIIQTSNHPNSTPVSHLSIFGREESEVLVSNMRNSEYLIQNVADEDGYVLINLKLRGG